MNSPTINVTPLIDVLLVLLIIFMVVTPLRPAAFKEKLPSEQTEQTADPHPYTIVIRIDSDGKLAINNANSSGTVEDPAPLTMSLQEIFAQRLANTAFRETGTEDPAFSYPDHVQRTVFIKALRNISYGDVARVIDAAKLGGAVPISLQLDSPE